MFKVSINWLIEIIQSNLGRKIFLDEVLKILEIQGFEVKTIQDTGEDKVITIEVKANRPDMLCHFGVAREILANIGINAKKEKIDFGIQCGGFPVEIKIENGTCKRFTAIIVTNINNAAQTPEYVRKRLEILGVASINAAVDFSNYIMLEFGQPTHIYDLDKIKGNFLNVEKSKKNFSLETVGSKEFCVKAGDILIGDDEGTACVAGIIGSKRVEIDKDTKNILIESAVFDEIAIRIAAKRERISTLSSFRFERGVNAHSSIDIGIFLAKKITETCGGKILSNVFDYFYFPEKENRKEIVLRMQRANVFLGTSFSLEEIIKLLSKYAFSCKVENGNILVTPPDFRLDVKIEEDLIEEIARSVGYDNIKAEMPITRMNYTKNEILENREKARGALLGFGFDEVITYAFIPENTMELLGITKENRFFSDLKLQNPIASAYALMRPTMSYSMFSSLAYNYSVSNRDLKIFELGRVYFRDSSFDTGCREIDVLSCALTGTKFENTWGTTKKIKYDFYDLTSYIKAVFDTFGQEFTLKKNEYPFLKNGCEIISGDRFCGVCGELAKETFMELVPNSKLINDNVYFCEIYTESFHDTHRNLEFESKFPPIIRLYNFVCLEDIDAGKIAEIIKNTSKIVHKCLVKDVYKDDSERCVLFEVIYRLRERTLSSEEIEGIENEFLECLEKEFGVFIKDKNALNHRCNLVN
jgi:phenylalanyl-tRNA synthetase beta chain